MNESESKSVPEWWQQVARPHLERIKNPHKGKKQATVMAVVHWQLLGIPIQWKKNPAVCSAQTWSSKWQHEPEIAEALHAIMDAIRESRQGKAAETVENALLLLQENAGTAVEQLLAILTAGSTKDNDRLRAIDSLLDRASAATAGKAPTGTRADVDEAIERIYGSRSSAS